MSAIQSLKPGLALEITATLAGRHVGLCGFDAFDTRRISAVLAGAGALPTVFDMRLLTESARICDGLLLQVSRLVKASPDGLRAAAESRAPVLAIADG